jgi:hypothetical protein
MNAHEIKKHERFDDWSNFSSSNERRRFWASVSYFRKSEASTKINSVSQTTRKCTSTKTHVTSSYARNVFFQLKKHISFSVVRARHDDKFVTRLTFVIRIVWFTKLHDKNIAFFFLSNSSSYMKRNSRKEIWAESEAIDRDVWRSRFADV